MTMNTTHSYIHQCTDAEKGETINSFLFVAYLLYPPPPDCWLGETAMLSGVERFTVGFTLFTCLLPLMKFTIVVGVLLWFWSAVNNKIHHYKELFSYFHPCLGLSPSDFFYQNSVYIYNCSHMCYSPTHNIFLD